MNTPRKSARQAGWNLIELMVVVSIITILLAILINTAVEGSGPKEQTKVTMRAAMAAATEYEVATTLKIDHFTGNVGTGGVGERSVARLCYDLWKLDKTRTMLLSLGKDAVTPGANNSAPMAILDGWGRNMRYYGGLGASKDADKLDANGKPYSNIHNGATTVVALTAAGMPSSKDPYIASAGPDGKWGTVDANNKPNTDAKDNMYSFNLD